MGLSFGEYPDFATRVDACLSCSNVILIGRPSNNSHRDNCGSASANKDAAIAIISDSVVDREVDDCRLQIHAMGKNEFSPAIARKAPDAEL